MRKHQGPIRKWEGKRDQIRLYIIIYSPHYCKLFIFLFILLFWYQRFMEGGDFSLLDDLFHHLPRSNIYFQEDILLI